MPAQGGGMEIIMLAICSDHAGVDLKEVIKNYLAEKDIAIKDFGAYTKDSVDYPDIAEKACAAVVSGECDKVILICGTGIGMSICANKIKGIRCCACSDTYSARLSRNHNDANALAIGARVLGEELAKDIVDSFLNAEFMGGKHLKRVEKINALENK